MIWTAGRIVADDALSVGVLDRTFEHGLGLFETFRTWRGRAPLLDRHLARLHRSAEALRLPLDPRSLPDSEAVGSLLRADGRDGDAVLRITLSGGLSESGGSFLWMRTHPIPPPPPAGAARVSRTVAVVPGDALAGFKTLNYWARRLAYEQAREDGSDEMLTLRDGRWLVEGTRTNLFLVRRGALHTHPLDGSLVPGVMRRVILERAATLGVACREEPYGLDALDEADEAFLTNSVRGVVPLAELLHRRLPAPGPLTRRLGDEVRTWLDSGGQAG